MDARTTTPGQWFSGAVPIIALVATALLLVGPVRALEMAAQGDPAFPKAVLLYRHPLAVPNTLFLNHASGKTQSLVQLHGKVVIVNLWATWCASCVIELPTLNQLQKDLGNDTFQVVTISIDKEDVSVEQFFRESGWTALYPGVDRDAQLMKSLGVQVIPTSIIIDRQGRQVGKVVGPTLWTDLRMEEALRALMGRR